MGRATRWLKSLFGIKKDREQKANSCFNHSRDKKCSTSSYSARDSRGLCHNPETIPPNISPAEAAWLQSFYSETEKEQNKHAIAVAAATAAAADAAVAAAQAAVAVVRLTSHGRGTMFGGPEKWAAVKIQTVFRGYLARKALRALKGLVKIQALFRGYLVRKQATATLRSMQALIRAQATVRTHRTRGIMNKNHDAYRSEMGARKSMERFDDIRSEHTAAIHSRRLSANSFDTTNNNPTSIDAGSPKIVEVDTGCRPKSSRSRRTNNSMSDFGDDLPFQTISSPLPCQHTPVRLSVPAYRRAFHESSEWGLITGDECRFSTAQSTPRFANSCASNPPVTPAKSVCTDNYFRQCYGDFPNYMANTQSFKAKLRSHSAPKQRPDTGQKKRLSLNEMMESRNSLSGVRMQRSCSQAQETIHFKNAIIGKLLRDHPSLQESQKRETAFRGEGE